MSFNVGQFVFSIIKLLTFSCAHRGVSLDLDFFVKVLSEQNPLNEKNKIEGKMKKTFKPSNILLKISRCSWRTP
jgi:hypothetical protein